MEALSILIGIVFGLVGCLPAIALVWLATRRPVIDATWHTATENEQLQIEARHD